MSLILTPTQIRVSFSVRPHYSGLDKVLENLQGWSVHITKVFFSLILSTNEPLTSQFVPILSHPAFCTIVMVLPQQATSTPLRLGRES